MKKRVLIGILAGAIVVSALFAGCSKSKKSSDSETPTDTSTAVTTQSTTETTTSSATETTTTSENSTTDATEQTTTQESAPTTPATETSQTTSSTTTEEPTVAEEVTPDTTTEAPVEEATRTDGSVLTNTEYRDAQWGMKIEFPTNWQNDNIYVLNSNGQEGRTLTFAEKTNYDSGKEFGLIFELQATYEPVEESNNTKNLGSFIDQSGNTLYLSYFRPSDVRANIFDETLTENYRQVFSQKDDALASITFDDERQFQSMVN